jgi:lysophospholipase L1-like esterase
MLPQRDNCLMRHDTRSRALIPSCRGVLFATPVETNSLGLRGPEPRHDGSPRILALGDSCTMGWKVRQDESYPAVLEKQLEAAGTRVQVLNAGVPGYTSHQGLSYLREAGLALDPEVVVIAFGWNDATRSGDVVEQIENERRYAPIIRLDDWLLLHSVFYRWVRTASNRSRPAERLVPRVDLEQSRRNLDAMTALAAERGAKVVFVSFIGGGHGDGHHASAIARAAADHDAPLIVYEGPRLDVVHPTAEGYRWLAEQIARAIEERGWLAKRADAPAT